MITRRQAILFGFEIPWVLAGARAWAAPAGEFWNSKDPSDWSDEEVRRLLTDSPWAKEVAAEFDFDTAGRGGAGERGGRRGGMGGGTAGGMDGMGGGGMGGRGGMGGGRGGMGGGGMGAPGGGVTGTGAKGGQSGEGPPRGSRILIRWETAKAVRDAARKALASDAAGDYVISVAGLGFLGSRRRGTGGDSAEEESERRNVVEERLRDSTELQRKGQPALHPERIETSPEGSILFFFTRDYHPIRPNDREVTFVSKFGPMVVKAKFNLKEMMYRGKLEM